jgi:fibronectin type 3 domain-containing protein
MADASHLVATVRGTRDLVNSWTDSTTQPGTTYTYYVTALDRLHHESYPSNPVVTRTRAS